MVSTYFTLSVGEKTIPILDDLRPVSVVGLFGRSRLKPSSISSIVNASIPGANFKDDGPADEVQCYHDGSTGILYLYLGRLHRPEQLENLDKQSSYSDYHDETIRMRVDEVQQWLWILSVCHFIILFHPSQTFDISYIRLFRTVQRHLLSGPGDHPEIRRLRCPQLLFVFQSNPASMHLPAKKGRTGLTQQCRTLTLEMETQIYHIFRKCRLLSSDLLGIPSPGEAKEPFVLFVEGRTRLSADGTSSRHVDTGLFYMLQLSATTPQYTPTTSEEWLSTFITRNVRQGKESQHLARISLKDWYSLATSLMDTFCKDFCNRPSLTKVLNVEEEFSERRGKKMLPLAISAYTANLPDFYTATVHETQLARAIHLLRSRVKGPAQERYVATLRKECTGMWEEGRRGCEVLSLTGNPCSLALHEENRPHTNRLRLRSACNCGRSLSYRGDPFTLEAANSDFYSGISDKCCHSKVHGSPTLRWTVSTIDGAYQNTQGMEQPGFVAGSQFLQAWEVGTRKGGGGGGRKGRSFLGMEYECSKGHRFYGGPTGSLYLNCASHTNKPMVGQLMRVVVSTQEQILLQLSVLYQGRQINLTTREPIPLGGNKITVIRLPFVYSDDNGQPLTLDPDAQLRYQVLSRTTNKMD